QLDHPQRAVDLVQQAGAGAHVLDLPQSLGERLDLLAGNPQGLVELGLDPAEGGGVDRVAHHCHWSSPPAAGPGAGPAARRVLAAIRRSAPPQAGSLKSATERRRSAASCARFPIDCAVWLAPWLVCEV